MNIDRNFQLTASLQQGFHKRVVDVGAKPSGKAEAQTLVTQFSNAPGSNLNTSLQLLYCFFTPSRFLVTLEIKSAPQFKTVRIPGIFGIKAVKPGADSAGQNNRLFNA